MFIICNIPTNNHYNNVTGYKKRLQFGNVIQWKIINEKMKYQNTVKQKY